MVFRIQIEKKTLYDTEAKKLFWEIKNFLGIETVKNFRMIYRYDIEGISVEVFEKSKRGVFAGSAADMIIEALPSGENITVFAAQSLPGQYDLRSDTFSQCLQIFTEEGRPAVKYTKIYAIETYEKPQDGDIEKIKNHLINKIESREVSLDEYESLADDYDIPEKIKTIDGFINLDETGLKKFLDEYALAMDFDDILFCRDYFKNFEKRDPTVTEIRMIDTYWSDHCRHTTFFTEITDIEIYDPIVEGAFENYLDLRREVYGEKKPKSVTLMDMATIAAKYGKKQGRLSKLEESEEVNACSVNITVDVDGKNEDWLLMFKNETHNHPTEIEPFGGAETCLGGGIRDPLSGRSYVYQAMRITGAADPRKKINETIKGKLPQFKITKTAADGYSSYGNQVGSASGLILEIYHKNYAAKRMELGALVGAAPKSNVIRGVPVPGDVIILVGGKTGRDGCGAATGSSKAQNSESLEKSGAEVQKGDAFEERNIIRLFRDPKFASMIKRCNDFGAGGVSVAIGELADSILIDLSLVPVKYPGLDGTEIAISESQERMAVVVAKENADEFIRGAENENLEAAKVAEVTGENRLKMVWEGEQILSLDRGFLNSNGAKKYAKVKVAAKDAEKTNDIFNILYNKIKNDDIRQEYLEMLSDLNICSQKGLAEQFDSSIGSGTVIAPFGGPHRLTPAQSMAAKIPVLHKNTKTASVMAHGYSPYLSEISPYRGAMYAVVESVAKLAASGVNLSDIYLSFQEYFPRIQNDPERFGMPFEALLGALEAQIGLELAAVGGKDSMSGSYSYEDDITGEKMTADVPPALISFAVGTIKDEKIVSNEFKKVSSYVYLLKPDYDEERIINFEDLKKLYNYFFKLNEENMVLSSYAVGYGGVGEAVFKMCAGAGIGFKFENAVKREELFSSCYGALVVESPSPLRHGELIGRTDPSPNICIYNQILDLNEMTYKWLLPLENVFTTELDKIKDDKAEKVPKFEYYNRPKCEAHVSQNLFYNNPATNKVYKNGNFAKPKAILPVFPGTNCEYDMSEHLKKAGILSDIFIFLNKKPGSVNESIQILAQKISESQILAIPGGYSGGNEPVGSGDFIAAVLRKPQITEAVRRLLFEKDGLIIGFGNGFQALVKSGLLPYGDIKEPEEIQNGPFFGINRIGRHQSMIIYTRVASVSSPWFANVNVGDIHTLPVSHGEGRIILSAEQSENLVKNGQIATQYCDLSGEPTMHPYYNPGFSAFAIEGLFSPDGRILGKMGHNDRIDKNIMKNVPGNKDQQIFISGAEYFK